jgi:hypothetical protein
MTLEKHRAALKYPASHNGCAEPQFSDATCRFKNFLTTFISGTLRLVTVSDWGIRKNCYLTYYVGTQCPIGDRNESPPEIFFLPVYDDVRGCLTQKD